MCIRDRYWTKALLAPKTRDNTFKEIRKDRQPQMIDALIASSKEESSIRADVIQTLGQMGEKFPEHKDKIGAAIKEAVDYGVGGGSDKATRSKNLVNQNAAHAVIVSSGGFTKSAISRSDELVELTLLEYDQLVDKYSDAFGNCLADGNCGLELLWSVDKIDGAGPGWLMYKYGKCIRCHTFHVLCRDCGSEFPIPDGHTVRCDCGDRQWGAIPESEASGHTGTPESTWLILKFGEEFYGLQRKPIGKVASQLKT